MDVTLRIPEELAGQVHAFRDRLPEILQLGLKSWKGSQCVEFPDLTAILEKLAELPTPKEVLELRPSASLQARLEALLEKNRGAGLSAEEEREWQSYEFVEHLVRMAKAKAAAKLKAS